MKIPVFTGMTKDFLNYFCSTPIVYCVITSPCPPRPPLNTLYFQRHEKRQRFAIGYWALDLPQIETALGF